MKRVFVALLLGAALVSGCGGRPVAAPKTTLVNIALQNCVGYGLFYLAQEKGFCDEEGVFLNFVDDQLDYSRNLAFNEGVLDVESVTVDLLVSKAAHGTPVQMVMEIDMSFGSAAIVAAENIKALEDLAGKKVALVRDDVGETFLSVLFQEKGLPFDRIIPVSRFPGDVGKAFLAGEADACVTLEPHVSEALKRPGAHVLASTKDHPGIIIDTLNVRKDLIDKDPELVKKIMRVWFKALDYYKTHPDEASGIISKHYGLTPEEYRKQTEGLLWYDYQGQRKPSETQEWITAFNKVADAKTVNGRITSKPEAEKFINRTLLETLYEDSK